MKIEPTEITENGVTMNMLTHTSDYYACGYEEGSSQALLMSKEGKPCLANTKIKSLLSGFGAETYQELLDEMYDAGISPPT